MRVNVVVVVIRIGIVVKDFEQMILNKSQCSFARRRHRLDRAKNYTNAMSVYIVNITFLYYFLSKCPQMDDEKIGVFDIEQY